MAKRTTTTPPEIKVKDFTVSEIDAGIRKLKRRIEEVQMLKTSEVRFDDARVRTAETNIREAVRDVFGQQSPEFHDHQHHEIWKGGFNVYDEDYECQSKFVEGMSQTVLMLEGLISRLEEKREDLSEVPSPSSSQPDFKTITDTRRIFVVHGHDEEAKLSVARFLEKIKLEAVVLSERPNEGRTVIEKFEVNADVSFAVVLLTPDDVGSSVVETTNLRPRARQNVILELGYFVGRLGRSRVCALHKGSIEIPSDFHGVVYVAMDDADGWKLKLAREMKQAGLNVDLNLAI